MSHHIYTTPGFIVHSAPHGEAGKFFLIFTRDLGMIGAMAQGVRLSQSKLRYHAQDFSSSLFSVVKGKEIWRVTGATEMGGGDSMTIKGANKRLYVRVLSLLKRLLQGEEKNQKLFKVLENFHGYLSVNILEKENRESVEYLTVLRILECLGYISHNNSFQHLLSNSILNEEMLAKVKNSKEQIVKEINNGLKESQL